MWLLLFGCFKEHLHQWAAVGPCGGRFLSCREEGGSCSAGEDCRCQRRRGLEMHRGSIRALAELEARRSILCSAADWSWWYRYFDSRFCCMDRVLRLAKAAGAIITIDQAIEAGSFLDGAHFRNSIDKGDLEAGFKASDLVWEGTTYVIGQHAFPMEKQAALAVPEEKKGMTAPWCLLLTSIDHLWAMSFSETWHTWHCTPEIKIISQPTRTWHLVPTIFFSIFVFFDFIYLTSLVSIFEKMTSPNESCPKRPFQTTKIWNSTQGHDFCRAKCLGDENTAMLIIVTKQSSSLAEYFAHEIHSFSDMTLWIPPAKKQKTWPTNEGRGNPPKKQPP